MIEKTLQLIAHYQPVILTSDKVGDLIVQRQEFDVCNVQYHDGERIAYERDLDYRRAVQAVKDWYARAYPAVEHSVEQVQRSVKQGAFIHAKQG